MRIGILADTHDRVPAVAALLRRFVERGVSHVLHAGDYCSPFALAPFGDAGIPLLGVFGRNDGDHDALRAFAATLPAGGVLYAGPHSVELDGHGVLLVHDPADVPVRSVEAHAVVLYGSTHEAEMAERGRTLLVNPGEACGWLTGAPSGAVLDLDARRVEFLTL